MEKQVDRTGRGRWFMLAVSYGIILTASSAVAQPASGTGTLVAEATIYEDAVNTNGGGYSSICVGNLSLTNRTRRGFFRYDLPAIPSGSTVTRVTLTITQERVRFRGAGPKPATLELRRVTSAWSEGAGINAQAACGGGVPVAGINWSNQPSARSTASASEPLSTTNGITVAFDTDVAGDDDGLLADVQAWVNGGARDIERTLRDTESP